MRVDAQIDDKDLRDKMKLCQKYSPVDFGIDEDFAMMKGTECGVKQIGGQI